MVESWFDTSGANDSVEVAEGMISDEKNEYISDFEAESLSISSPSSSRSFPINSSGIKTLQWKMKSLLEKKAYGGSGRTIDSRVMGRVYFIFYVQRNKQMHKFEREKGRYNTQ